MCEEMCAYGEEHSKECQIFEKLDPKLAIDDFSKSSSLYWCITALRALTLRESDPQKYDIIKRMMVSCNLKNLNRNIHNARILGKEEKRRIAQAKIKPANR